MPNLTPLKVSHPKEMDSKNIRRKTMHMKPGLRKELIV
jgi:hypothetical protein